MCPFWTGLLVFIGCGGPLLRCVVPSLLAWHSVMETTMVEPVRRGAFTPWHQTWHRAHPGFSAAQLGSPINPPAPLLLIPSLTFTASPPLQLQFLPPCLAAPLLLSSSPSLPLSRVHFSSSLSSQFQPFFCATMQAIQPKSPLNTQILPRNAIAVWISPLRFTPALSAELLCISHSLRGHCFPSHQCGRELDVGVEGKLLASCPVGENRERGRSAKKVLTGHLERRCEAQP